MEKYCKHCGAKNEEDARFCGKCGEEFKGKFWTRLSDLWEDILLPFFLFLYWLVIIIGSILVLLLLWYGVFRVKYYNHFWNVPIENKDNIMLVVEYSHDSTYRLYGNFWKQNIAECFQYITKQNDGTFMKKNRDVSIELRNYGDGFKDIRIYSYRDSVSIRILDWRRRFDVPLEGEAKVEIAKHIDDTISEISYYDANGDLLYAGKYDNINNQFLDEFDERSYRSYHFGVFAYYDTDYYGMKYYIGEINSDKKHGYGIIVLSDNKDIIFGHWCNDVLISCDKLKYKTGHEFKGKMPEFSDYDTIAKIKKQNEGF